MPVKILSRKRVISDMLEMNTLYNMDCMEGMKQFPDGFFDLAIVDPPYGLDASSVQGSGKLKTRVLNTGNVHDWDSAPDKSYFDELFRVSKNAVIWGGGITSTFLRHVAYCVGINCNRGRISHR